MSSKKIKLHPHQRAALAYLKTLPKKIVFEIPARATGLSFIALNREVIDSTVARPLVVKPKHTVKK